MWASGGLVAGAAVKHNRTLLDGRWDKHDTKDSANIADLICQGKLHQVREAIKEIKDKIEDLCIEFPEYLCLLSIPGFGPDVSSKVLGAIGNPFRFISGKQVLKMAGFDLCANRSGKASNSAMPVISKQGKADLRYALYQAAFIASTHNKSFMTYYTKQAQRQAEGKGNWNEDAC